METNKLRSKLTTTELKAKSLNTVELVELYLKAEDACKYTERLYLKIEAYISCKEWSRKMDSCLKNMLLIHQEMQAKLEEHGAFNTIEGQ